MNGDGLVGTVIHGYRVEQKLGAGGMGQVWIARHQHLPDLLRVVKTLLPEYAKVDQIRQRFFDEARIVSRFDHDNIIRVENFGELPSGELFLLMPLLQGRPLDEILRTAGKLGPHHVLTIVAQIASALQYAHARGIVHRDLKPGNVFLERKGNVDAVKLLDFGIAKDASGSNANQKTRAGSAMGTPFYMACEQYDDAASVGPTADIFALGVMIIEMLTGQLPWGVHQDGVLYFRQKTEAPTLTGDIPRAWNPILLAALAPDPSRRPPSARAFIVALANELPALPPIWKSGAQIVKDVAPHLITDATPDEATVRAKSNSPVSAIPIYPSVASGASSPMPPSNPSAHTPAYAVSMPPTANERPAAVTPAAPSPTTLSASSGMSVAPPLTSAKPRAGALIALGLGIAAIAGALIFGATRLRGNHSEREPGSSMAASPADAGTEVARDAQREAVAPIDASAMIAAPTDAAAMAVAPVDAGVDATNVTTTRQVSGSSKTTKTTKTTSTSSRSTGSKAKSTSTTPPTGSATPPKFDPNAPLGED